jgi:hypothetical protein
MVAAASVRVAGTVVAAWVAVTGALVGWGVLAAVVSAASGGDGDNHARPRDLRSIAAHEPGGKGGVPETLVDAAGSHRMGVVVQIGM